MAAGQKDPAQHPPRRYLASDQTSGVFLRPVLFFFLMSPNGHSELCHYFAAFPAKINAASQPSAMLAILSLADGVPWRSGLITGTRSSDSEQVAMGGSRKLNVAIITTCTQAGRMMPVRRWPQCGLPSAGYVMENTVPTLSGSDMWAAILSPIRASSMLRLCRGGSLFSGSIREALAPSSQHPRPLTTYWFGHVFSAPWLQFPVVPMCVPETLLPLCLFVLSSSAVFRDDIALLLSPRQPQIQTLTKDTEMSPTFYFLIMLIHCSLLEKIDKIIEEIKIKNLCILIYVKQNGSAIGIEIMPICSF